MRDAGEAIPCRPRRKADSSEKNIQSATAAYLKMESSEKSKYQKWYDGLVCSRKQLFNSSPYTEIHHILPRSLGGGDEDENLVSLTYREHFIAHWLMTKFQTGPALHKMRRALFAMTLQSNGTRLVAGWQFEVAKRAIRDSQIATSIRRATEEARQIVLQRERDACVRRFLDMRNELSRQSDIILKQHGSPKIAIQGVAFEIKRRSRRRRRPRPGKRQREAMRAELLASQS